MNKHQRVSGEGFVVYHHYDKETVSFRHLQVCFNKYDDAKKLADAVCGEVTTIPLHWKRCHCGVSGDQFVFIGGRSCNRCSDIAPRDVILAPY